MALNWNVEKCKDWKILTNNSEQKPYTKPITKGSSK